MIISTSPNIGGKKVTKTLGIARGNTVRSRNAARDIFAALKNIVGGEIDEYTKKKRVSLIKFLSARKIGILVSTKPGQEHLRLAQKLAKKLGLGVGISSGANFLGAVLAQNKYGKDFTAITVFCDDSKKYLTSDLLKDEPVREGFITPFIELIDMEGTCVCDTRIVNGTCIQFDSAFYDFSE